MNRPLSVVNTDQDAIVNLLSIHSPAHSKILDCTYSTGSMWRGLKYDIVKCDLTANNKIDIQADCMAMPFLSNVFDVIVFDPPHIADGGSGGIMHKRYGSNKGLGLSILMERFLCDASRVLVPNGLVLAKIANGVHSNRFNNMSRLFLDYAELSGFEQVDESIRVSNHLINDPKWNRILHLRRAHVYWLAVKCV